MFSTLSRRQRKAVFAPRGLQRAATRTVPESRRVFVIYGPIRELEFADFVAIVSALRRCCMSEFNAGQVNDLLDQPDCAPEAKALAALSEHIPSPKRV
jgi:hypothetical protein